MEWAVDLADTPPNRKSSAVSPRNSTHRILLCCPRCFDSDTLVTKCVGCSSHTKQFPGTPETPILWAPNVKNWSIGKDPNTGKDWRQEKGTPEDEIVGMHHRLNGHKFEQTVGDGEGQGSLACCSWLNNNSNKLMSHSLLNSDAYSPVESTRFWRRRVHEAASMSDDNLKSRRSPVLPTVWLQIRSSTSPPRVCFSPLPGAQSYEPPTLFSITQGAHQALPVFPVFQVCSAPQSGSSRFPPDGAIIALTSLLSHLLGAHCPLLPISRVLKYFLKSSFIFWGGDVSGRYINLVPVTLSWPGAEIYNSLVNFYIPFWIQ